MNEWKPISTAPFDTEVMLFGKVPMGGCADRDVANVFAVGAYEDWYTPEWVDHEGESLSFDPTHWMPLPEPPKL